MLLNSHKAKFSPIAQSIVAENDRMLSSGASTSPLLALEYV